MQKNYNENLVAGAAIRDDKGRRISKLFESPHPKMTVGYAKNLIMPDTPTEQEFNFRQSGGGVIEDGVAVIDKVKGNSVVWNQLIGTHNTAKLNSTVAGVTISTNTDESVREYTLNGTATEDPIFSPISTQQANKPSIINGHKYLIFSVSTSGAFCQWKRYDDDAELLRGNGANIIAATTNGTLRFNIRCDAGTEFKNEKYIPRVIDLTQMFGAGNEPTTYKEFLSRKPKVADEYAYNEGTIVNNKVEKVVTTGRNLWDEEWEVGSLNGVTGQPMASAFVFRSKNYCPILGGTEYYLASASFPINLFYYDKDKNFIVGNIFYGENVAFTTPRNAAYFKVRTDSPNNIYNHDICINLSEPTINGQYFPYEKHELDLSWVKDIKDAEGVKLFEDGMKSAGTSFDEAAKGRATKRIGVVDLGSLDISKFNTNTPPTEETKGIARFLIVIDNIMQRENFANQIVQLGYTAISNISVASMVDRTFFTYTNKRVFYNLKCDASNYNREWFKEQMQGQYLYYELAEPIEVEYDEKSLTYPVIAGGTEEAIASEPSSAFRADIGYGIDAVKTILDLKARVKALEEK